MLLLCCPGLAFASGSSPPNFLLLITDDQRWDALGKVQREQGDAGRFPWLYTPFIPAGSVRDELVINEDIAPTFLDLAGMKNAPGTMHGRSLRPLFRARHTDWRKSFLFQYFLDPPYPEVPIAFALRTDTAKLIRYETNPDWVELFDLKSDPYETANLAGQLAHRPLLEELQLELVRQAEAVHCQLPDPLRTLPR